MNFEKMKQTELAKAIGVSTKTLQRWANEGLPRNMDGSYSLPRLFEWVTDRAKNSLEPSSLEGDRWLAAYRKERAKIAKIERKQLQGKLVPLEEISTAWASRLYEVSSMLKQFSHRLPGIMVGKSRDEMHKILDDETWLILDRYSRDGEFCHPPETEQEVSDGKES